MGRLILIVALLAGCSTATTELHTDNDFFTMLNEDKYYSNGVALRTTIAKENGERWTVGGAHQIYTPHKKKIAELQPHDRPYAGYAYTELRHEANEGPRTDTTGVQLGIVGPSARGEQVQNGFHKMISNSLAAGWDNQLRDEPILNFDWTRRIRTAENSAGPLEIKVFSYFGGNIGNALTAARVGSEIVAEKQFGDWRWATFGGSEGKLKARDIFLDGNLWKDSHRVDKEPLVGEMRVGMILSYKRIYIRYTYRAISEEFKEQESRYHYGSVQIGVGNWQW